MDNPFSLIYRASDTIVASTFAPPASPALPDCTNASVPPIRSGAGAPRRQVNS
jgi:hypothetical protein